MLTSNCLHIIQRVVKSSSKRSCLGLQSLLSTDDTLRGRQATLFCGLKILLLGFIIIATGRVGGLICDLIV